MKHILSLQTEKELLQEKLLPHFLAGESVTAMWVPHGGRKKALNFLVENSEHFGYTKLGKYKFIYVDYNFLTESAPEAFFRLALSVLNPDKKRNFARQSAFFFLQEEVKDFLEDGYHLIFILMGFDGIDFPSNFFNNLKALWQFDKKKIHFLFVVNKTIFPQENFRKYDQLRELLAQNLVYFPHFSVQDAGFASDFIAQRYGYKVTKQAKQLALKYAGGNPSLIKSCLGVVSKKKKVNEKSARKLFEGQFEIEIILEDIWNSLDPEEKLIISQIAGGTAKKGMKVPERLLGLKIVLQIKNSYGLFSDLFVDFVKKQGMVKRVLSLKKDTEEVLVNSLPAKEQFTLKEYDLLVYLLKNKGKVVSRDQLGDILWGKDAYEKYSDWAIDQIISQLRKKLEELGISGSTLQTVRNRGYRLVE